MAWTIRGSLQPLTHASICRPWRLSGLLSLSTNSSLDRKWRSWLLSAENYNAALSRAEYFDLPAVYAAPESRQLLRLPRSAIMGNKALVLGIL